MHAPAHPGGRGERNALPPSSPPLAVSNHRFQDAGRIRTYRGEYVSFVEEIQFLEGDWEFTLAGVFEAIKASEVRRFEQG